MRYSFVVLSLFVISLAQSQVVNYKGVVTNQNLSDINYFISLKALGDASVSYSEVTDQNGNFEFKDIPVGSYERSVKWFNKTQTDTIQLHQDILDDIIYLYDENIIDGVVVEMSVRKPLVQNKFGVLVVNIEDNPIFNTGTVLEAIAKLPGVSYNHSNNSFKVKGKSGILIQFNGEELLLSKNEAAEYLKTIPAEDIENIEIITNPSSKYNARGIGGIINIVSKKNRRQGYFVNVGSHSTFGRYFQQNTNVRLQYNRLKSQHVFRYSNAFGSTFEEAFTETRFSDATSKQQTFAKISSNTNLLDYTFVQDFKKSKLKLNATGTFYSEDINQDTDLEFFNNQNGASQGMVLSNQQSSNKLKNLIVNLKYDVNFDKSKLTLRSYYLRYDIDNNSNLLSMSNNVANVNLDNLSSRKANLFVSQADYAITIDTLSSIDIGAKSIFQKIDNINDFYNVISGNPVFDYQKSNSYDYSESILSGYSEYKRKINNFDFVLGARVEYNPLKGYNPKNNYTLKRDELYLFPFVNIAYQHSENSNFNLSYNKRINRPSFADLLPFEYYVDPYTTISGNPYLVSNISHSIDFQYILRNRYIFGVNYTYNKDQIFQTPILDNNSNTTVLKPTNIDDGQLVSFSNNSSFRLFKAVDLNLNTVVLYNKIKSNKENVYINSENFSYQFVANGSYVFSNDYTIGVTFEYVSPFIQGPYKTDELMIMNASISKAFFDNRLRVSVVGSDILNTYKINNRLNNDLQSSFTRQILDTRWVRLSLTYRFEKGLSKGVESDANIINEVKNRVK